MYTEKSKPGLNLNWNLARWLRGLCNITRLKIYSWSPFFLWKNKCSLRRKFKEAAWSKYNGLLRTSLYSSVTSLLSISYIQQGLKYYNLCHSALHLGSQNNTHVSQIFDLHPKEKQKAFLFFSCFSVVLHYLLKVLSTATIPLVFECRSNKELTIKINS